MQEKVILMMEKTGFKEVHEHIQQHCACQEIFKKKTEHDQDLFWDYVRGAKVLKS